MLPDRIHLVDIDGCDVPVTEKNAVPHDPTEANQWPAWCDNWFWTPTPERDAEDVLALATPTPTDLADLDAWLAQYDAVPPPDDPADDGLAFPTPHTAASRRQFAASVAAFFTRTR